MRATAMAAMTILALATVAGAGVLQDPATCDTQRTRLADFAPIVLAQTVQPAADVAGQPTYFVFSHDRGYVPTFHWHLAFGDPFIGLILIHPVFLSDDQVILAAWNYDTVPRAVEITFWHR